MASSSSTKHAGLNKQGRARFAKETINNYIPYVLKSNEKARHGVQNTELVSYSASSPVSRSKAKQVASEASNLPNLEEARGGPSTSKSTEGPAQPELKPPIIRVIQSDTYDAVEAIVKSSDFHGRVAALNMASALHPGGGVLHGAMAQEESLCLRSTLFATLNDSFYRIPEKAAIYSPDVLIFRSSDNQDMPKADWFYTDVISCAALKNPDLMLEDRRNTQNVVYEWQEDYENMLTKIRLIMQIAMEKGITHLVLGALGCGAYHNPPEEVAKIFRKVILGGKKRAGVVGIEEIVFAIFDDGENLRVFKKVFQDLASQ